MDVPIVGGYILLSRKLLDSGIMNKPPEYLKTWIYLLSKANHSPRNNLQRGQGFTSIPELIDVLSYEVGYRKEKPTKKKVHGIIEWLRNPNEGDNEGTTKGAMIVTTKVTHGFIYTICNYNIYQDPRNYEGNNEGNYEGITKEQRREELGNNKYKNYKNYNNNSFLSSISNTKNYPQYPQFWDWVEKHNFVDCKYPNEDHYYLRYLYDKIAYFTHIYGRDHIETKNVVMMLEEKKVKCSLEIIKKAHDLVVGKDGN